MAIWGVLVLAIIQVPMCIVSLLGNRSASVSVLFLIKI
jgi:hypothetical protein